MTTETVLISDCSSGIGRETTITFLEDGWEGYATDPNPTISPGSRSAAMKQSNST